MRWTGMVLVGSAVWSLLAVTSWVLQAPHFPSGGPIAYASAAPPPADGAGAPPAQGSGPALLSPDDGANLEGLGATLQWAYPEGSTWFHIQVAPYNDAGPGIDLKIGDTVSVRSAQYQLREPEFGAMDPNYVMLPGMTYTWRVRSASIMGVPTEQDWSDWSTRTLRTAVRNGGTIGAVQPREGAVVSSVTPTLIWINTDRSVFYYEVQVSKRGDFQGGPGAPFLYWEVRHGALTNPTNSYAIPQRYPLEPGTAYYWRVRPRTQGDAAPAGWSGTFSFTTG